MRIEGFKNVEDIMKLFDPNLFFIKDFTRKEEIQECLVSTAMKLHDCKNLREEIELREEFGSTYFGNSIAILHPMHSTTNASFIGEIILEKPAQWDIEGNYVNLIFLLLAAVTIVVTSFKGGILANSSSIKLVLNGNLPPDS